MGEGSLPQHADGPTEEAHEKGKWKKREREKEGEGGWCAMRRRGLLESAFYPRSKWQCATYAIDYLCLCTCHFANWLTHRSHMDHLYPHRTPDILEITSRLVIGIIPTTHESVPCSELSFAVSSTYERHPIITRTKPIEVPVTRLCYSFFPFLCYRLYDDVLVSV